MVKLEITEQQAGALVQLIDLAIKAGGLNVAEAGVFFTKLIQPQLQSEAAPEGARGEQAVEPDIETSQVDLKG